MAQGHERHRLRLNSGISETTARQHLSGLYRRTGALNAAQAAYHLGRTDTGPDGSGLGR